MPDCSSRGQTPTQALPLPLRVPERGSLRPVALMGPAGWPAAAACPPLGLVWLRSRGPGAPVPPHLHRQWGGAVQEQVQDRHGHFSLKPVRLAPGSG